MRLGSHRISTAQVLVLIFFIALSTVPAGAAGRGKSPRKRHAHFVGQQAAEVLSPEESRRAIAARARQVLMALKARDMARFSTLVHPQKGVRFSPYASVLPDEDRLVKRSQLVQMWASQKRSKWGSYDGSGDPIWLTFKKYYQRFIFDHDFSRAKDIAYNPGSMSYGNTPNTIREFYPKSIAVGYHFSGFDPKFSGMDWRTLWLVFEKKGSVWYLVGIVHDEWTI